MTCMPTLRSNTRTRARPRRLSRRGAVMAASLRGTTVGGAAAGWAAGVAAQAAAGAAHAAISRVAIPGHWREHFSTVSQIVDPSQFYPYIKAATQSLVSGVTAHIKGDMAVALEKAYRTYSEKYRNVSPFDTY